MPLYEYKCLNCGDVSEAFQKATDAPLKKCAACGGPLKKILSPPALQFKGTGWYITDYAQKKTPEKKEEKPPSPKEESSKDKKSPSSPGSD